MSATAPASVPTTGTWQIDATHSTVTFTVAHNVVATFRSGFHGVSGSLENGVLSGSVAVENLELGGPAVFREHLLGEGFFDAASHPTLNFSSQDIHAHDDGSLHANGELTIKGVTKPVHATGTVNGPTEDFVGNTRLGFTLETKINRTEFGLNWNADLPKGGKALSDEVTLIVELEFNKV